MKETLSAIKAGFFSLSLFFNYFITHYIHVLCKCPGHGYNLGPEILGWLLVVSNTLPGVQMLSRMSQLLLWSIWWFGFGLCLPLSVTEYFCSVVWGQNRIGYALHFVLFRYWYLFVSFYLFNHTIQSELILYISTILYTLNISYAWVA